MSKFKVGDKVVIEAGWKNEWVSGMDETIGLIGIVVPVDEYGVELRFEHSYLSGYGFPPSSLELVEYGE